MVLIAMQDFLVKGKEYMVKTGKKKQDQVLRKLSFKWEIKGKRLTYCHENQ